MHIAIGLADFSAMKALVIEASARARGHGYVSLAADAADAAKRGVLFVTHGRDAKTIKKLAAHLNDPGCPPEQIDTLNIDVSPAFIQGVSQELRIARNTFDKSTSSGVPTRPWTSCAASSSARSSPPRGCAGRCSRTAPA